jgi:hypothetical protein
MDHARRFAQSIADFGAVNPELTRGRPPAFGAAAHFSECGTHRIVEAGGAVVSHLMHPAFVPLEQLYRRRPDEGIYVASAQNNYRFELGAFRVPSQMAFALVDYRFDIYRLNGAVPGDFVPIEERRLSTHVGYDVNIDKYRKGNLLYQLEPAPVPAASMASVAFAPSPGVIAGGDDFGGVIPPQISDTFNPFFPPSSPPLGATAADFASAQANQFAATSGVGLSTLPQRTERQGPLPLPFTLIVGSNQRIAFEVVVFLGIPIPIAFFEVSMTGVLMPANELDLILRSMKPCAPAQNVGGPQ